MIKPALSALLLLASAVPALAGSSQPVRVVELFTSQGCSSCPPANKFVAKLAERAAETDDTDTLALSYGVTYWDYLGWTDTFGDARFTERQRRYSESLPSKMYTPQIVVNGEVDAARWKRSDVERHMLDVASVDIRADGERLRVSGDLPADAVIALVAYTPGTQDVAVKRGENHGRTLRLANVVTAVDYADWNGAPLDIAAPTDALAVLVHDRNSGDIVAAANWTP